MSPTCVLVSSSVCPFHQNLILRPSLTGTTSFCVSPKLSPLILPDFHLFHTVDCYCLLLSGNGSGNIAILSFDIMTSTSVKNNKYKKYCCYNHFYCTSFLTLQVTPLISPSTTSNTSFLSYLSKPLGIQFLSHCLI